VAEKAKRVKLGHPLDPETVIGPMIHPIHERKVLDYLEIGKREGATIAAGGGKVEGPGGGCYVAPTLFTSAHNGMRIAQEEIFGPVLTAIPFKHEAEALALANEVQYGLTGYLWTSDVTRALRFTDQLEAGMIWVNSENVRHLPTPFGGVKGSGIGRDGGDWSYQERRLCDGQACHPETWRLVPKHMRLLTKNIGVCPTLLRYIYIYITLDFWRCSTSIFDHWKPARADALRLAIEAKLKHKEECDVSRRSRWHVRPATSSFAACAEELLCRRRMGQTAIRSYA
jgi:hypothetical protein